MGKSAFPASYDWVSLDHLVDSVELELLEAINDSLLELDLFQAKYPVNFDHVE